MGFLDNATVKARHSFLYIIGGRVGAHSKVLKEPEAMERQNKQRNYCNNKLKGTT